MEISGDLSGIRTSQLREFEELLNLKTERQELLNLDLAKGLAAFTEAWNREIAVYINRSGIVVAAAVGKHASVDLPKLKGRLKAQRLRCLHTHPDGSAALSPVDFSALSALGLECLVALGTLKGEITGAEAAILGERGIESFKLTPKELPVFDLRQAGLTKQMRQRPVEAAGVEKALLLGLADDPEVGYEHLAELQELARTAGVTTVGRILQPRRSGNAHTYLGKGRLEELHYRIQETSANVLICDDELKPSQLRSLEEGTNLKVLDRTTLILDIFAQRARSREGKLQVELAQLQHLLPYLSGLGQNLSRLGGGVGTRGPGESKLESDRRRVRQRITLLERELADVQKSRQTRRQQRQESGLPLVALVGYTNSGKTTFMQKALLQLGNLSSVPAGENKLFATLDPIVRKLPIRKDREILLSDTVGFIRKLPHTLLKAFLATLEEVHQATILLHILDAGNPRALEQAETVHAVLKELEVSDKPIVTVLNKIDQVSSEADLNRLAQQLPNPVALSLLRNDPLEPVWEMIEKICRVEF